MTATKTSKAIYSGELITQDDRKLPVLKKVMVLFSMLISSVYAEVDLVKVHKSAGKMSLYAGQKLVKEYHIALGGSPKGHKQQEGDEKTPEGSYILDYKKEDSAFYRAMHVSYPNDTDKAIAERLGVSPGGFIMVHGQRNGLGWLAPLTQKFNWTNGCIALTNTEMDEFMDMVPVGAEIQIVW